MSYDSFNEFYEGTPPWEIARPQPAVAELAERGGFTGRVIDVGCGTGENSLLLASRGHTVLGVDGADRAVEKARAKARQRQLDAEFTVADAFQLTGLGRQFDTALDSAFLHIPGNTAENRRIYTAQLASVLESGGWAHFLEISEQSGEHPSLTSAEIVGSLGTDSWKNAEVSTATYAGTDGDIPAWLVSVQRV